MLIDYINQENNNKVIEDIKKKNRERLVKIMKGGEFMIDSIENDINPCLQTLLPHQLT